MRRRLGRSTVDAIWCAPFTLHRAAVHDRSLSHTTGHAYYALTPLLNLKALGLQQRDHSRRGGQSSTAQDCDGTRCTNRDTPTHPHINSARTRTHTHTLIHSLRQHAQPHTHTAALTVTHSLTHKSCSKRKSCSTLPWCHPCVNLTCPSHRVTAGGVQTKFHSADTTFDVFRYPPWRPYQHSSSGGGGVKASATSEARSVFVFALV